MKMKVFTAVATLFIGAPALAQLEDVTCETPDCLTGGYQLSNENGLFELASCKSGDCNANGWEISDILGGAREVRCANNSCFGDGFQEFDLLTTDLIRTRVCSDGGTGTPDCLTHGWTDTYAGTPERVEQVIPSNGFSVQDGFLIQEIEEQDSTAALEQEIADLKAERKVKKQELRDYLRSLSWSERKQNRYTIREKAKEIVALTRQIRKKKKELRSGGGAPETVIVSERLAQCKDSSGQTVDSSQNPGSCFINGYVAQ